MLMAMTSKCSRAVALMPVAEVVPQQLLAVGAAVLVEVQHHALAGLGGLGDVLADVQEGVLEPVGLAW
jgi:hypothetical protein